MTLRRLIAPCFALAVLAGSQAAAQVNPGTSPLSGAKGGTNNAFMQFAGPATSLKTFTLPNASDTIATLAAVRTWTGAQSFTDGTLILLGSSSGSSTLKAPATGGGTATLFPGSDTVMGVAATQTPTNKTFNCANNTCTVRLGSDVTGQLPIANGGTAASTAAAARANLGIGGVNAKNLGVKQDGIALTATVSITSGTGALTATGAAFAVTDVGKQIMVAGAGTASGYLTTTIASFTDATHVGLTANAATTVTTASENVTYCTDDAANIATAVTSVLANNQTLVFTDGIVCHASTNNWAFNNLHVQFPTDNATFIHTGTGIANSFSGILQYPASQGAVNGVFGGPGRPMMRGNPNSNTTVPVKVDNWHFGYMKVAIHDGTAAGLQCRDGGIVGASAVVSTFDIRVSGLSSSGDGPFIIVPNSGIDCTKPVGSIFEKPHIEGTGTGGNFQVVFTGAVDNQIRGGTIESGLAGGIIEDSTSRGNTYINSDTESNGTAEDLKLAGTSDVLINARAGGTTAGTKFNGVSTQLTGGVFQNAVINDNTLRAQGAGFTVACTNNGTHNTIVDQPATVGGVASNLCTAIEASTSIPENKAFDTANANTLGLNGHLISSTTGTGAVVMLNSGPTMPNIAAPSSPAAGNNTVWPDSTDLRFHDKNSAGIIGTTVVADTGAANNFLTAISAAGAISKSVPSTTVAGQACANGSTCGLATATNALGSNTALNNTANYFDGPSMPQGSTGTWKATGTVSLSGTAGDVLFCKIWDGTTVLSSSQVELAGNTRATMSLSGVLASPAANIRISCRDTTSTAGLILFNATGSSKDSSIFGVRVN